MKTLLSILFALGIGIYFGTSLLSPKPVTLGSVYNPTGGGTYRLQSSIGTTDSSFTLTSFSEPISAIKYTMTYLNSSIEYGTFEPQSNNREFISFTGITQNSDGSATLTGVSRGLAPSYPFTASTTFQLPHAGQSLFILSNPPQLYNNFYNLNNVATSSNILIFGSTTPPRYDNVAAQGTGTYISTTSELVSWAGLAAVTNAGTVNGTTGVKGIYQTGTALQTASSTALGSTGASLALTSANATDTPQYGCAAGYTGIAGAGCSIIADLTGHIKQAWIDLSANWTFTGAVNILASASKKLTLNGLAYAFPSSQSANTVLTTDGTGNLSWGNTTVLLVSTTTQQNMTYATTTFSAANNLHVVFHIPNLVSADQLCLTFNGDVGANYGFGVFKDYSLVSKDSAIPFIETGSSLSTTTTSSFTTMDIRNITADRKQGVWTATASDSGSHSPIMSSGSYVWNNTSAQITSIVFDGSSGVCNFQLPAGSMIQVYGN